MKILHVILSSGFAGSERSTAESCNSQLAAGHQLGLVVRRGHRGPTGASVLDHVDQAVRRFEVPNLFFSRRALARAIREFKPDVIAQGDGSDSFGDVNQLQALRECYPGATYLHRGRSYEVLTWNTTSFGPPYIKVKPGAPNRSTAPRITTWINAGLTAADIIEGHYIASDQGFFAECAMQITEKVEGYTETPPGEYRAYKDLRQRNPNLKSRHRNFRTTGVLISIKQPWLKARGLKEDLAARLAV